MDQWSRIHLPRQEMQVQSLGEEDPLEKEMATHSNILAIEIPRTEEGNICEIQKFLVGWWASVHSFPKSWIQLND